jgi:hypothetical protein
MMNSEVALQASEKEETMSADSPDPIAYVARPAQTEQPPALLQNTDAAHITRAATPEELRAVETLFAQRARTDDSPGLAGLWFTYGAGMLLRDVLKDTFTPETEEVEDEEERRKKDEEK